MKKVVIPCVLSAVLGAILAVTVSRAPDPQQQTAAQEMGVPAMPVRPAVPVAPAPPGDPRGRMPLAEPDVRQPAYDDLTPEERVNVAVYENVNRAVVNINTRSVQTDKFMLFEIPSEGEGSGSVIDRQGHVLTNFHVVDGAREIQVTLFNGTTYEARMVGQDPSSDLAILKIEAPADLLFPVIFGDSTRLKVGQRVYAIGNPFGLERTLSTGIISSLNRSLPSRLKRRTMKSIIQIDAAINPGNSGGPLLDSHARMIGMNTAIASKTGESAGVGFAIPVATIARVVPLLLRDGRVVRPDIGIAQVYQTDRGLLIATMVPGGAAEKAGLQGPRVIRRRKQQGPFVYETQTIDRSAADLITAIDGQPIKTGDDFLSIIESKQPGETVAVTVIRAGQEKRVSVRLEAGE